MATNFFENCDKTHLAVYIASPFFNNEQIDKVVQVRAWLSTFSNVVTFSPFHDGVVLKPNDDRKTRQDAFDVNVGTIQYCDLVVAIIDDKDTGTLFEIGMAYGVKRPVLAITFDGQTKLNLMLAHGFACYGSFKDEVLNDFVKTLANTKEYLNTKFMKLRQQSLRLEADQKDLEETIHAATHELQARALELSQMQSLVDAEYDTYAKMIDEFKDVTLFNGEVE